MNVKDTSFNQVIANLVRQYGESYTPIKVEQKYICPLDEGNAKLLAQAMPGFFKQFADYVKNDSDWALSKIDSANLTSSDNWAAVYDPAIVSTQAVTPHEGCISGYEVFKTHNKDFLGESFCVQSDWVVRYIGQALQSRTYTPIPLTL